MRNWVCILILFGFSMNIYAQIDAHYWTHQYGAKGLLLNGAVIASSDDETAIFYNPAAMGQGNNLGFVFSFLTPTYSHLQNNNFTGDGSHFADNDLGFSPGFAAVRLKPFKSDKIILGIASFQRLSSDIMFTDRVVVPFENFDEIIYIGDLEFSRHLSQEWIGAGLSYNISENIGVGISQFSIWHSENLALNFRKEVNLKDDPETLVWGWRSKFSYGISAYGGWLTKFGFIWNTDQIKVGLTYTSQSYGFIKKGASYAYDDQRLTPILFDVKSNRKDIELNQLKTPSSVGFGLEFKWQDLTVSFSTEYFENIEEYTLFEDIDDPYDGLSTVDDPQTILVSTSDKSVWNFALGFQKKVNENRTWLWGFRTDFNQNSNLNINDVTDYLSSSPSIFHLSGGGRFLNKRNEISIGLDYGYGRKTGGRQLTDLSNFNAFNFFDFGTENNVTTSAHSIMIFLTYDFLFEKIKEVE